MIAELRLPESGLEAVVSATGQHIEMVADVLDWFGIQPEHSLGVMQPGQTLAGLTGRLLPELHRVMELERPACTMVQGDTTTAYAAALVSFYSHVPVAHVEAGLRTDNLRSPFPEEFYRRSITLMGQLHFAPTETAASALAREGHAAESVHVVGNTGIDALRLTRMRLEREAAIQKNGSQRHVLVTAHRRENHGAGLESICDALLTLAERNQELRFTFPVHLNPQVRRAAERLRQTDRIQLVEPQPYSEMVRLLVTSDFLLTDSGGLQEEAAALGKPTLVLRDTTERSEAVAAGTALLVGTDRELIVKTAERLLRDEAFYRSMAKPSGAFGDGFASGRIRRVLEATFRSKA